MKNVIGVGGRPPDPGRQSGQAKLQPLLQRLTYARWYLKEHGYEADARECERLIAAIREFDPGFEERR
jgi:hypothetical protein